MNVEARELLMAERGRERAKSRLDKTMARGDAASTSAGVALARRAVAPVSDAIRKLVATAKSGKPGRAHVAAVLLDGVDPDLAAFVAVKVAINGASRQYTLRAVAKGVAERLGAELTADAFEAENDALYRAVIRNAKARGLTADRQANAVMKANKEFAVVPCRWGPRERLLLGTKLIELIVETVGIVQLVDTKTSTTHTRKVVQFTPAIHAWFGRYNNAATLMRPLFMPTLTPPKDWENPYSGAFFSSELGTQTILSRGFPGQLEALEQSDMSAVYEGLNGLQRTPWRVNKQVLAVMHEAWERGLNLDCLPRREPEIIPSIPQEVQDDVKGGPLRKAWRAKVRAIHDRNASSLSQRFEFDRTLAFAAENAEEGTLYFPHRLDFRGRAYATATSLNPQGDDTARGLLEFAEGKALGERGMFWLGVHGANLFGNDKVSLEDRERWAWENAWRASDVAADPLGNLWWTEADKPWSFLAWCFEWGALVRNHPSVRGEFFSRLPIALDGSCNGIQHFSAMLRDPQGGAAVNLTPSDKPQDIYGRVAERVVERLKVHAEGNDENTWIAQNWIAFGIDRKITKRPVMVLPYGGTFKSCKEYVQDAVREKIAGGAENPFGDELFRATSVLASVVWHSISDVVVAAREAMSWLQQVAKVATKAGVPLKWTTPSGFVVCQQYRELKEDRIKTKFCGTSIRLTTTEESDKLDASRQTTAVAPNFVHSMDAAAMMLTVQACLAEGITAFAMIHDSYGTHAADTDKLAATLRREFVRMHLENDVLSDFLYAVSMSLEDEALADLPPPPAKGSLDLLGVLESPYFFA